jgi:hypothetical protein
MTESETGNPFPPLLYVWVRPFEETTTVKEEIDEATGMFALNE